MKKKDSEQKVMKKLERNPKRKRSGLSQRFSTDEIK
jgi:hypothetical protein